MAIRIFEMDGLSRYGNIPVMNAPFEGMQTGTVGAASVQSAEIGRPLVTIQSDEACFLVFGANPVATAAAGYKLAAGAEQSFTVDGGNKVAWIAA